MAVFLSGEGVKFTPGRTAIVLFFVPALSKLLRKGRHLVIADVFAFATSAWMVGSRIPSDGLNSSAVAEMLEFFGAYIVARGFFFGRPALETFIQALKSIAVVLIALSVMDPLLGTNVITHPMYPQERFGIIRATSVFEVAELYGTFCTSVAAILIYSEHNQIRRLLWTGLCLLGCILSLSTAPIMAFAIVLTVYTYDRLMGRFYWRWRVFVLVAIGLITVFFVSANNPVGWLVSHLTLDPSTGYFREYIFDLVYYQISLSPMTGYGFGPAGEDDFLAHASVDNAWLVYALRFGLPMIIFFLLTNIESFVRVGRTTVRMKDSYMNRIGTGFTLAVVSLSLIACTVHVYHTMWMFWAVCLGIRASIKEWYSC
jgi:hypothetical protein